MPVQGEKLTWDMSESVSNYGTEVLNWLSDLP